MGGPSADCLVCCLPDARVSNEHAVAVALQRLAKRQAARQYSAVNSGHQGHNWEHLFKKTDFSQEPIRNEDEMISVHDDANDGAIRAVRRDHIPRDRHASANATFETFVNYHQQPFINGSRQGNVGWFDDAADLGRSVAASARSSESMLHVEVRKENSGTDNSQTVGWELANEEKKSPPFSREEYNRQMKLISQKLSEEKLRLQKQLRQYPCLPRPPPTRPSSKNVVGHKRIIR